VVGKLRSYSETGRLRSKELNFNYFLREPPIDGKLLSEKESEDRRRQKSGVGVGIVIPAKAGI